MVRVLACHHFRSQKVGLCEGGVGVALADEVAIIAQEASISIYASETILSLSSWFTARRSKLDFPVGSFGGAYSFPTSSPVNLEKTNPESQKRSKTDSMKLHHSFCPVDLIHSILYNRRGHYLLCLEKRQTEGGVNSFRVRIYFQWDKPGTRGRTMKARIAGLVSPTGGEIDSDSLLMIEIPPEPLFATVATACCQDSGNIVTLSADSRVSVYVFRYKDGGGRGKPHFADFDMMLTIQVSGFNPSALTMSLNHIGIKNEMSLSVIRIHSPATSPAANGRLVPHRNEKKGGQEGECLMFSKKQLPKPLLLPTVLKENKKLKQPAGFEEEIHGDIHFSRSVISWQQPGRSFRVEDLLRLRREPHSTATIKHISITPVQIKSKVGGSLCLIGSETEMLLYHLPEAADGLVFRITTCPFTKPLLYLHFDSYYFHALTENGLETYSNRSLEPVLRDTESFSPLNNDCPLRGESPNLLGMKPFPGVRFFACSEHSILLVSQPPPPLHSTPPMKNESWTLYLLESPSIEEVVEETLRVSENTRESSPEVNLILLSEAHLILRNAISRRQDETIKEKYREVTRALGLAFIRKSTTEEETASEELNRGIAFLMMSDTNANFFFTREHEDLLRDPQLIRGIARFLRLNLRSSSGEEFPPSLSRAIVTFLSVCAVDELVRVTLENQWIREAQGQRIINALGSSGSSSGSKEDWRRDLGLILTLVAVHGTDYEGVAAIQKILSQSSNLQALQSEMKTHWILEKQKEKLRLSDLSIALSIASSELHVNTVVAGLGRNDFGLDEVILAFHQGVSLNADPGVKESLTRDLRRTLELFFKNRKSVQKDDEVHALHLLISSYLTNILQKQVRKPPFEVESRRNEIFGNIPAFLTPLVEDYAFANQAQEEDFHALSSLLASTLGKVRGAKKLVLRSLSNQSESPVTLSLTLLSESTSHVMDLILQKKPELLLLYAKDTFGDSVELWKSLVDKLKEVLHSNPQNCEIIAALTENVYLHLANNLSSSDLEVILEKEEEKGRFVSASDRVHAANEFSENVCILSSNFLSRT